MREKPRSIAVIAVLAAALGLAACNSEPTCDKAAEHVLTLIDQQNEKMLAKFPEGQRKQLAEMAAKSLSKDRLAEECTKSFSKEQIACTVAAKSLEDVSKCNQAANPAQPAQPTDPAQPTPAANPAQPTDPAQPPTGTDPAQPTQPTDPAQPPAGTEN